MWLLLSAQAPISKLVGDGQAFYCMGADAAARVEREQAPAPFDENRWNLRSVNVLVTFIKLMTFALAESEWSRRYYPGRIRKCCTLNVSNLYIQLLEKLIEFCRLN